VTNRSSPTICTALPSCAVIADAAGSGPVAFVNGATPSGLTYSFASLASTTDGLQFSTLASPSATNPADWAYAPTAGAGGIDPAVTYIRVKLGSSFAANGSFSVSFRAKVQ